MYHRAVSGEALEGARSLSLLQLRLHGVRQFLGVVILFGSSTSLLVRIGYQSGPAMSYGTPIYAHALVLSSLERSARYQPKIEVQQ